jgi:hypothetical protein
MVGVYVYDAGIGMDWGLEDKHPPIVEKKTISIVLPLINDNN